MRVFQELEFTGAAPALTEFAANVERRLSDGWVRNVQREQEVSGYGDSDRSYCFSCDAKAGRRAADLWLAPGRDTKSMHVGNIVPRAQSKLSHDEYNSILNEFFHAFVEPVAKDLGFSASLTKADVTLEDFASPKTAKLLRYFSRTANRSTGAAHPSDKQAWEEFVISAHLLSDNIYTDILNRWLVEEERWPVDEASELIIEYEQGRSLLKRYDSARVPAPVAQQGGPTPQEGPTPPKLRVIVH